MRAGVEGLRFGARARIEKDTCDFLRLRLGRGLKRGLGEGQVTATVFGETTHARSDPRFLTPEKLAHPSRSILPFREKKS